MITGDYLMEREQEREGKGRENMREGTLKQVVCRMG